MCSYVLKLDFVVSVSVSVHSLRATGLCAYGCESVLCATMLQGLQQGDRDVTVMAP